MQSSGAVAPLWETNHPAEGIDRGGKLLQFEQLRGVISGPMEAADGEKQSEIWRGNPNAVVIELEHEFCKLRPEIPPPKNADEEEYIAEEKLWETILGVHPYYWNGNTEKVSESNRNMVEEALNIKGKHIRNMDDHFNKIEELNITRDVEDTFDYVHIHPRSPLPRCFYWWHRMFRMTNTNPTSIRSKRFTEPDGCEYVSSDLLQFFSLRFAGDFSHGQTMCVYGFMAVRDDVDQLRNYIFNLSRDHAQEITPDSPDLLLTPPARGISATYNVMVEYSLKVKSNGSDASEKDDELIDGCFEFKQTPCSDIQLRNVRLFGLLGPIDVRFAFLRYAVEATIDIEVKRAIAGYNLSTVTASTCGYEDEIMLYDSSAPCPMAALNYGSSSLMAVASAVVAVELGCDLKLRIGFAAGEEFGLDRHVRKSFHELFFTAQKHNTTEELVVIDSIFEVSVKVTWSTMGKRFHPFFHSNRSLLGENPDGPCLTE